MTHSPSNPLRALRARSCCCWPWRPSPPSSRPRRARTGQAPLRSSEQVELNIYDAHLSEACGQSRWSRPSPAPTADVYRGRDAASPALELPTFDGRITWLARATGKTYATGRPACCTSRTRRASSSSSRPASP